MQPVRDSTKLHNELPPPVERHGRTFYIDYFTIINGIPYENISGNGRKRSFIEINIYLSIEGSRIQKEHVIMIYMNITCVSTANKVTVTKRGRQ